MNIFHLWRFSLSYEAVRDLRVCHPAAFNYLLEHFAKNNHIALLCFHLINFNESITAIRVKFKSLEYTCTRPNSI